MKVLIVEDEIDSRKLITFFLKEFFPDFQIIGEAASVRGAKTLVDTTKPDLIFLDVHLEDGTGLDLLKQINTENIQIIFTTAYDNYAIQAIKFNAIDYLLKPINPEEFNNSVLKAQKRFLLNKRMKSPEEQPNQSEKIIIVKTSEETYIIPVNDIIRLEADGAYTSIITHKRTIIASKNLKYYEKELPTENFIRIHQSHLINKQHITTLTNNGQLRLSNNDEVPISFRKKSLVRKFLKNKN